MTTPWPAITYEDWSATCDTLHAYTQVLGKLAVQLAPPEAQLQHTALRLTARGLETPTMPAPNGSGAIVVALDLRHHEAVVEHTNGADVHIPLTPNRPVAEVTHDVLEAVRNLAGRVVINTKPQEVPWKAALDQDTEHATYDDGQVETYFAAATQAALVLADFRAPYRGRMSPVNAWWGTFDVAVHLYSGRPADPPSDDFIMRNSGDAQQIEVGWWPGDPKHGDAAFFAFAYPVPDGFADGRIDPEAAHWSEELGEFVLEWDDVRRAEDPHAMAVEFARSAFRHACAACGWDETLAASADSNPVH